MSKQTIVN